MSDTLSYSDRWLPCLLRRPEAARHRGFSIVEVTISMLVVATMAAAAMCALGASQTTQLRLAQRSQATLLAQDLLAEILQFHYEDPDDLTVVFGRESSETSTATRLAHDDVDDYHGLSEAPPHSREGLDLPGAAGFSRIVGVQYVQPANLSQTSAADTGIKRITVSVLFGTRPVVTLTAYRTVRWIDPARESGLP